MDISVIQPYPKNAKKHPKKQIQQVANSIKEFGFNQPIVIDKDNVVIVGHGRLEAAKLLGLKDVPVIQVDLTEERAKAYRLADNKLNESEWDMDLVIEELKGLSEEMLDLTGFDKDLIIEPEENDDEVPEVPEEPQSKLGDLYELGNHRVLCGDSTKIEDVERLMDGKKADMVFTDPPYGQGFAIIGDTKLEYKDIYRDFIQNTISIVCQDNVYVCCNFACIGFFVEEAERAGYQMYEKIAWVKNLFGQGRLYHRQHEDIIFIGTGKYRKDKRNDDTDVWNINSMRNFGGNETAKEDVGHPTQKPVAVPERAISNSSIRGEIVYDGFSGSGSTLIAAHKTGRICYGMELDPKYVDVIVQRYVDYTGNTKVIKNGKEEIWQK